MGGTASVPTHDGLQATNSVDRATPSRRRVSNIRHMFSGASSAGPAEHGEAAEVRGTATLAQRRATRRRLSTEGLQRVWTDIVAEDTPLRPDLHLRATGLTAHSVFGRLMSSALYANDGSFGTRFSVRNSDGDLDQLGKGMDGEVFKVTRREDGREFALKTLQLESEQEASLHFELQHLSKLSHPNIVRLHDIYCHDVKTYLLAFELGAGGDVLELALANGPLEERRAARIVDQMLDAVKYLHFHNVMHRDLKLENFVLRRRGDDSVVLIDFGLATLCEPEARRGDVVGTLQYQAPEVLQRHYGFRSDLWSLGVISYMLLSAKRPFRGSSDMQTRRSILAHDLEFPAEQWADRTPEAVVFVKALLNPVESDRPSAVSARELPWLRNSRARSRLPEPESAFGVAQAAADKRDDEDSDHEAEEEQPAYGVPWETVLQRMRAFEQLPQLKRLATQIFVRELSGETIIPFYTIFRDLVGDGPGVVPFHRVRSLVPASKMSDAELERIFVAIDSDEKAFFNWNDFIAVLLGPDQGLIGVRCELETSFRRMSFLDTKHPHAITLEDLRGLLDDSFSKDELVRMLAEAVAWLGLPAKTKGLTLSDLSNLIISDAPHDAEGHRQ